jgi:hypothetical protein
MAAPTWEYVVQAAGGALKRAKPEGLTESLNAAAGDGWELVQIVPQEGINTLLIVLRRPLTPRARRKTTWSWQA